MPSWYPDWRRIISSYKDDRCEDIEKFGHNFEICIVNLDCTGLKLITRNWSSTSSHLLAGRNKAGLGVEPGPEEAKADKHLYYVLDGLTG